MSGEAWIHQGAFRVLILADNALTAVGRAPRGRGRGALFRGATRQGRAGPAGPARP
ncbi:hypothetical protein SSPO_085870 [Streptomyces antimycoticus]|uniref:Uncharacterized protein n=1 Tax=Streptomyces antimycoticus TaxID=68175 RepID=A0A499VA35_9ACTN|nr:hypothetical protein SSPO_085870 [Streptomyces antimycoticus]